MLPLILHIDTATEYASICLTQGDRILGMRVSPDQKQHGAFVQPAIQALMQENDLNLTALNAIAVTEGPGSYTGLRVSMASAKGLCYALDKPLITISTLKVMALAAQIKHGKDYPQAIYCPLIDARRMEVFTALYDGHLEPIATPSAMILDSASFKELVDNQIIVFSGTGAPKFKAVLNHPNALFSAVQHDASHLAILAIQAHEKAAFANLAYAEPYYLKAFYSAPAKK
ncbi:MAG: tRNA (adenosine(37)-N6)-threonylcarbamoyltransferase complex dimerization subunit type 1 TsaB [Bacteroidetes bacterium 24-39-8]|jgi:tRNA threonylcarbamoyladenosine biosynthesis protein TsaB|nr:MAG: tRNA (adenosine(37)-N6)-threonylcarbamoyltransferase complex dimerization subunit type 1 TsaB [Sphingobacteriia bacterium 35-40-8]OYZ52078.1 MAG: tRNA (adenosine(37)-N6)-threonylcarbamoyltransferase complex dimerization subunit type 1 TsaB [Bacteroidetes bacterium 24-39-8]OZA67321.1 MAG: tRNA (adenosine(37)-N6)-threonylcarbamoyltransferase complex dimerization subunit type 1 TsaB [Sphingobacteriia bacterium 39-39-8]HQR93042.1 tRNA (adenosine(37)-N6)-threonylcarbamoyltransferase complex d